MSGNSLYDLQMSFTVDSDGLEHIYPDKLADSLQKSQFFDFF